MSLRSLVAGPRCCGALYRDEEGKHDAGDRACLTCGWRFYAQAPESWTPRARQDGADGRFSGRKKVRALSAS